MKGMVWLITVTKPNIVGTFKEFEDVVKDGECLLVQYISDDVYQQICTLTDESDVIPTVKELCCPGLTYRFVRSDNLKMRGDVYE